MQVVWLKSALNNLDEIAKYISQESSHAAQQVVDLIIEQVNQLTAQPALGRSGRVVGTRELVVINTHYLVPYRIKNNKVQVLRVFHTSRRPPKVW